MRLNLTLNDKPQTWEIAVTTLLDALRRHGGLQRRNTVARPARVWRVHRAAGRRAGRLVHPFGRAGRRSRRHNRGGAGRAPGPGLETHRRAASLQQAFIETGAIQCGYCTPAQLLVAEALRPKPPIPPSRNPSGALRRAVSLHAYVQPVQAVLRAAARMRGEDVPRAGQAGAAGQRAGACRRPHQPSIAPVPPVLLARRRFQLPPRSSPRPRPGMSASEPKVDAVKLAQGKPAFTADVESRGMLVGKLLHSPIAHGYIRRDRRQRGRVRCRRARSAHLPGCAASCTAPRANPHPDPGPLDFGSLEIASCAAWGIRLAAAGPPRPRRSPWICPAPIKVQMTSCRRSSTRGASSLDPARRSSTSSRIYAPFAERDPLRGLRAHSTSRCWLRGRSHEDR